IGPRMVVATGALILGAGLCFTALIGQLWVGYLTYGIGVGVGAACCYVPTLASVGGWFVKRRNTALGIAAAGTGFGTMVIAPVAARLIERYGWRTTNLMFGIAAAALLLGCAAILERPPTATPATMTNPRIGGVYRSREFILLYLSWALATTALFVPFVFLPAFARDHGAGVVASALLLSLIGGTSVIGRLAFGCLADRIAVVPLFKATVLMMGVSYAIWLLSPSYIWLIVFACVLGVSYGSRISLMPGMLIEYFGTQNLGAVLGVFFSSSGFSAAIGPPLAGFVVDLTGSYGWGVAFALAMGLLGFAAIVPLAMPHSIRHCAAAD
ncbi:MAG: MFS transporter, partial [Candidatus Binataceae bacterium]